MCTGVPLLAPTPPQSDRRVLLQQPSSSGRSGPLTPTSTRTQAAAGNGKPPEGRVPPPHRLPLCSHPTAWMGPPPFPALPYLWTRAWAARGPHHPRWPEVPTRAGAPRTGWCHRPTRAGSPLRWSWPAGRWTAKCPGRRTGDRCTRMCRRQTGSRSRHRSSRRSLGGADRRSVQGVGLGVYGYGVCISVWYGYGCV